MANKTMHHIVIGDDTFELIDEAGREETTALKEDLSESVGDLKNALNEYFDNPSHIFSGNLSYNIINTATTIFEMLTNEIAVNGGNRITYEIEDIGSTDDSKISNVKLVVERRDAGHNVLYTNSYSSTKTITLTSNVAYIKLGLSASTNNQAIGETIYANVNAFYPDEPSGTFLGDSVKVNASNVVGGIELVDSGNVKTGAWQHLTWSSVNGYVPEADNIKQHAVMKIPGEVSGGNYYTLAWENEFDYRVYLTEFSDDTYSPASLVKSQNWLPYESTTHEYAKNKQILLDESTRYIAIMTYSPTDVESWENLRLINLYIEPGKDATGFVLGDVINSGNIDGTKIFDQLSSGNIVDGVPLPPEYYNAQGYLYNKCERINEILSNVAVYGDAFIFATDQHWYLNAKQSPKLIRYVVRHCHIPRLISGGDTDNGGSEELCKLYRYAFSGNIHHVVGNHDLMSSQYKRSNGAILYYMMDAMNENQIGNNYGHYYYVDCHQQKIRYIVLASFKGGQDNTNVEFDYSAEQLTWFTSQALNVPNGYGIIIFTHFMRNTYVPTAASSFINAIDAYSGNGKILAVVQGHTHCDGLFYTNTGVPIITVTCDKNSPWINSGVDMEPWLTSDRETGTIYEQAFDVMGVNVTDSTIHAVRIGALAMDNYASSDNANFSPDGVAQERIVHCEPIDISNGATLTPTITGTITWKSSNNDVATVANGTVVKLSAGNAFISASNSDGIYEYWSVVAAN